MAPTLFMAFLKFFSKSYPFIMTLPSVGFISLNINLIVVVFPAPLGPIKPTTSPVSTENDISSTIVLFFICFFKFIHSNTFSLLIYNILSFKNNSNS